MLEIMQKKCGKSIIALCSVYTKTNRLPALPPKLMYKRAQTKLFDEVKT